MPDEREADIDSLLDDVPLEGEEDAKPEESKALTTKSKDDDEKDDKDDDKSAVSAKDVDKHLKAALKAHLPKPDLAVAMVDILSPGTALVRLDWFKNITPLQHLLLAFSGILMAAIATNPEVIQKMREGFNRTPRKPKAKDAAGKAANPKVAQPRPDRPLADASTPSLPAQPTPEPTA